MTVGRSGRGGVNIWGRSKGSPPPFLPTILTPGVRTTHHKVHASYIGRVVIITTIRKKKKFVLDWEGERVPHPPYLRLLVRCEGDDPLHRHGHPQQVGGALPQVQGPQVLEGPREGLQGGVGAAPEDGAAVVNHLAGGLDGRRRRESAQGLPSSGRGKKKEESPSRLGGENLCDVQSVRL